MVIIPETAEEREVILESEVWATQSAANIEWVWTLFTWGETGGIPGVTEELVTPEVWVPELRGAAWIEEAPAIEGLDIITDREEVIEPTVPTELDITRENFRNIQDKLRLGEELSAEDKRVAARISTLIGEWQTQSQIFWEEEAAAVGWALRPTEAGDIAQKIITWDRSLTEIWLPRWASPDQIDRFLASQWFTEWQIIQIRDNIDLLRREEKVTAAWAEAISAAEQALDERLASQTARIEEQWAARIQNQQRLRSQRGLWRSSATEEIIAKEQSAVDSLIRQAESTAAAEKAIFIAQQQWADAETIGRLRESFAGQQAVLSEKLEISVAAQRATNDELQADFETSVNQMLWILETWWEDISGIDKEKSKQLWYFINSDWTIFLNKSQNPVEFKSTGTQEFTPAEIDSFATWLAAWKVKFSDLDLTPDATAKVLTAMNLKLDGQPWLSTDRLKAQRILKDLWLWVDDESVNTVTNLLKISDEQTVRDMISTEEFKNAAFVQWNQKLFDDLRKDSQSFKDIDRTFTGMSKIFEDFQTNPSANRAAMEQSLIIMFNKMLDPGSVVREGEFDRTAQGQSVISSATWFLQRLEAGWAWITDETFKDIVNIAWVLHQAAIDTVEDLKASYRLVAPDLWADPKFVDKFFQFWFDLPKEFKFTWQETEDDILDRITWATGKWVTAESGKVILTTWSTFEDKSSFLDEGLDKADQTAEPKDVTSFIKEQEGFSPESFFDVKQQTIWFWTKAKPWETSITREEAERRLLDKINEVDNKITQVFWTDLTSWQKIALTSFMFNLWTNIFAKPESQTLKNAILAWDEEIIKQQFVLFNKAWGKKLPWLVKRRNRELEQFFIT